MQPHEEAEYNRRLEAARQAGQDLQKELEVTLVDWFRTHSKTLGIRGASTTITAMLAETVAHALIFDHVLTGRCFHKGALDSQQAVKLVLDVNGITMTDGALWMQLQRMAKDQRDETPKDQQGPLPTNPGPESMN